MSEAPWEAPDLQYHQHSILPDWARQSRQETDEAARNQQESVKWSESSHSERPRSYSNSPHIFPHPQQVPPFQHQTTFFSPVVSGQSQPISAPAHHSIYGSSHGAPTSHEFDVGSPYHRRGGSMPSLNLGSSAPTGPRYLFRQPSNEQRPSDSLGGTDTQEWSHLSGQHMRSLPVRPTMQPSRASYDQSSAYLQASQPLPVHGFGDEAPLQQSVRDWQHGQSTNPSLSNPLDPAGQQVTYDRSDSSSSWQAVPYIQHPYYHPQASGDYATLEHELSITHPSTLNPYSHPDTRHEEGSYTDPMYPLPHMQLPDATEHPQTWRHVTEGGLYAPHTVPTGMPSSHFEAVPTTAPADLSLSISPVTKGMLNLSTNVTAPPQAPQDTSQQGAFYLPGEDEHYIQSSMTSPYSEVPSVGHYVQLAYTPSAGQPSPLIGQMGQHPPHDYFADYQSVLYEEAARSAPHHHTAPPISTGSTSEQAVSGKNRSRKASAQASKTKRQTRQYQGVCNNCQKHFATVTLRGLDADFSHPYFLQYYCMTCAPNILAVKPMSDIEASKPDEKQKGKFNKKRIRPTDPSSPATCDVCLRPAAYGGPVPLDLETELTFHTEVVCDHCTSRYARCSDCGGGGGARCGVGKWRCRELFSEGRKTCSLNHSRQSNVSSMQYSTMRIRDVSHNEMPEIMTKCQRVFQLALLSTLAVPEVLERGTANASTFADVQDKVEKGWEEACRVFQDDKEESEGLRRYLGVRWSAPKPRKTAASTRRSPDEKAAQVSSPDLTQESATPDHIIMPGMNVAGFVTAEWSMYEGTIFISISVPYTTGEQYEGAAHLINMLQTRAHRERDEMLADFDAAGRHAESASIPPIKHTFTMIFFTPDSKYMAFLESKRQLLPLERYLAKYPETNPDIFPPRRKTFMSDERAAEMTCIVRHLHSQESDGTKRSAAKASARSSQQRNSKQAAAS